MVKFGFYFLFFLCFLYVSGQLFFKESTDKYFSLAAAQFESVFLPDRVDMPLFKEIKDLRIIYPERISSFEPTLLNPATRLRTVNIYEGLVKLNKNLNPMPALALSWGMIDDNVWEFELRKGVKFHDMSDFSASDVVSSFNRAMKYEKSEVKEELSNIDKIEILSDTRIRIFISNPDPLFLQKLSLLLICPEEYEDESMDDVPIGTASYAFDSVSEDALFLKKFDAHWGHGANFDTVSVFSVLDRSKRLDDFFEGKADFLAFVPQDAAILALRYGFNVVKIPSLEVYFLLFNFESEIFRSLENRKIFATLFDYDEFVALLGENVQRAGQFVGNGVFGFNPKILFYESDFKTAKKLIIDNNLYRYDLNISLPEGLESLGDFLANQLKNAGMKVELSYFDNELYFEELSKGLADIYFLGFKSELADASAFLTKVAFSSGKSNFNNYGSSKVDYLIDMAETTLDHVERLGFLQEAMSILIEEDFLGLPLFEYETVYSFVPDLQFVPRVDGLIYYDEINLSLNEN